MLESGTAAVVIIDVQEKLFSVMHEKERLADNICRLISGAKVLGVPVLWMEQTPEKMGPTIESIRTLLPGGQPVAKATFSGWGEAAFRDAVHRSGRRQFIIAGIETHVCVYQTAVDLKAEGFVVEVVGDAVSSRTPRSVELGLAKLRQCDVPVGTTEMVLFEMMRTSTHPGFRDILRIVR